MSNLIDKAKEFVANKIAEIPKPEATIEDVDLKGVNMSGVSYHAKVGVSNPYSQSIPICEIDYVLKSGGSPIVSGKIPDPGSIKGNGKTILDVPMLVPHSIVKSLIKDIFRDWDIDYELEIVLIIDLPVIGNITIPLKTNGEIKLPSVKDFFGCGDKEEEPKKE